MTMGIACAAAALWARAEPEAQTNAAPAHTVPAIVWHRGEEGHGKPVVAGDAVYFLTRAHGVLAVRAGSGHTLWQQSTGGPAAAPQPGAIPPSGDATRHSDASPYGDALQYGNALQYSDATSGSTLVIAGAVLVAGDYNLTAFDRVTGARRWQFAPTLGHAPGLFLGEQANGLVYTGSGAGRLHAVVAASGELAWSALAATTTASSVFAPVTDGHIVAAAYTEFTRPASGGVSCFDASTGRLLWRSAFRPAADPLLGTGAAGGPLLYDGVVLAARGDGGIVAFDRRTGIVRWTLPSIDTVPAVLRGPFPLPPPGSSPDYRPLALSGAVLVAGSLKGDVVAWDLRTRRERWHVLDPSLGSVAYGLSVDRDVVYAPFGAGRQVALSVLTGRERWRTADGDRFFWPAASDGRRVFMGGAGGLRAVWR